MSAPKAITTDAIFTGFRTRSDRSLGFTGCTPELSDSDMVAFMGIRQLNVKLLIQPQDSAPEGLVEVKSEFSQKSPSVRLRNSLFVLHRQKTLAQQISIPFEAFYLDAMNRLIGSVQDQLEPDNHR